jgi:hypothetical protein
MKKSGFSAIEASICLALFLIILLAAYESFGIAKDFFLRLKKGEEENQTAVAALDKMRIDLLRAGSGLLSPIRLEKVDGIAIANDALIILNAGRTLSLLEDIYEGQASLSVETTTELSPGREVSVFDETKAEIKTISSIKGNSIALSSPIEASYSMNETRIALLEKTVLFFDEKAGTIRRKVNASPAQPLLEEVLDFEFVYEEEANLAKLVFTLKNNKEKKHELWVYPKNIALATTKP